MNILFQDLSLAIYKHAFVPNVFHFKLKGICQVMEFFLHTLKSPWRLCVIWLSCSHMFRGYCSLYPFEGLTLSLTITDWKHYFVPTSSLYRNLLMRSFYVLA